MNRTLTLGTVWTNWDRTLRTVQTWPPVTIIFWANAEARWAEMHLILKRNQLFVSGLYSSQHCFFCIRHSETCRQMNLDDTLKMKH